MTGTLLYLVGVPSSGKSTLMKELTRGLPRRPAGSPVPHEWLGDGAALELGKTRESFSGTDALSLGIQKKAIEFIEQHPARLILAEGDRLANDKFFSAVTAAGYRFELVYVDVPADVAAARRRARGSNQNVQWLTGRATKVRRLIDRWAHWTVDATTPTALQAEFLRANIKPLDVLS